jgi:long-chain acyl-CoA synthetase
MVVDFNVLTEQQPDHIAVIDADAESWSRERLCSLSNRLARALRGSGLSPGDSVAVLSTNRAEYLALYLAAMQTGLYLVPLNWHLAPTEIAYLLQDSHCKALFVDARVAAVVKDLLESDALAVCAKISWGGAVAEFVDIQTYSEPFSDAPLSDPVLGQIMPYTSATTGKPKGVHVPQRASEPAWQRQARSLTSFGVELDAPNVHLCASMLYHRAPLELAMVCLHKGQTIVLPRHLDPLQLLRLIETHHVTTGFIAPSMFVRLLKLPDEARQRYSTASLKWIMHAGAPCSLDVKRRMMQWWGPVLWDDFGCSESGNVALCSPQEWLKHPGTVGRPVPNVLLKILDEDGNELPRGQIGLIYLGLEPNKRFRYKGDPDKTRQSYRGDLFTVGDVGYLNAEGYLFLCGRSIDMIVSGGAKIYSAEIEQVLVSHPLVADCAVLGRPDELMGEVVIAIVQPLPGVTVGAPLTRDILKFLSERIGAFKLPRRIEYISELPRDPSGKLRKRRLLDA